MSKLDQLNHEAECRSLQSLIGGSIEGIIEDTASDYPFHGLLVINKGRRFHVWVQCDPEGNGPGHLNIEPQP